MEAKVSRSDPKQSKYSKAIGSKEKRSFSIEEKSPWYRSTEPPPAKDDQYENNSRNNISESSANEYNDDEFEDYSDDFDSGDDKTALMAPKATVEGRRGIEKWHVGHSHLGVLDVSASIYLSPNIKNREQADEANSMPSSFFLKALDPRAIRMKSILRHISLEQENMTLFDQMPIAPYDMYHWRLRGEERRIRQVLCQSNDERRSVDQQSDEILLKDAYMQFHLIDDTEFYDHLSRKDFEGSRFRAKITKKLLSFVRFSAELFERFLLKKNTSRFGSPSYRDSDDPYYLDMNTNHVSNAVNPIPAIVAFALSKDLASIVTFHSKVLNNESPLYGKSISLLWNLGDDRPTFCLMADGTLTCGAIDSDDRYILAGSSEGSLFVWDLDNADKDYGKDVGEAFFYCADFEESSTSHIDEVLSVAFQHRERGSSHESRIYSFSIDGILILWLLTNEKGIHRQEVIDSPQELLGDHIRLLEYKRIDTASYPSKSNIYAPSSPYAHCDIVYFSEKHEDRMYLGYADGTIMIASSYRATIMQRYSLSLREEGFLCTEGVSQILESPHSDSVFLTVSKCSWIHLWDININHPVFSINIDDYTGDIASRSETMSITAVWWSQSHSSRIHVLDASWNAYSISTDRKFANRVTFVETLKKKMDPSNFQIGNVTIEGQEQLGKVVFATSKSKLVVVRLPLDLR